MNQAVPLPDSAVTRLTLSDGNTIGVTDLPPSLIPSAESFERLWRCRPGEQATIILHGRPTIIPRWQQAYGHDYRFSGKRSSALPVPDILQPYLDWASTAVDARLNGLLLNWYDGAQGHYIGPHHDETRQLVAGSPIVTISLGEERVFRLTRHEKRDGRHVVVDTQHLPVPPGTVIILPWTTNLAWKHGVPHAARYRRRRISVTLRAFRADADGGGAAPP